jgi:hypothetical protein
VLALFEKDFSSSKEILYHEWLQRPWHRRGRERLLGRVEKLISRLGTWLRRHFGVGQPPG